MSHSDNCIFCKIAAGAIPSRKVYEDDELFVFHDINPWAPVHFLMIPKAHILAMEQGCNAYPAGGFRTVINTGEEGGQEVHHLHMHVIGGARPWLKG